MLKKLDHPNIIKLYEFYEDEKRCYLVTELCTGGELYDEIAYRNKGIKEEDASFILRQIISAVLYCHLQGIVHRNVKPENIILDSKYNNYIKLMEFGDSFEIN